MDLRENLKLLFYWAGSLVSGVALSHIIYSAVVHSISALSQMQWLWTSVSEFYLRVLERIAASDV